MVPPRREYHLPHHGIELYRIRFVFFGFRAKHRTNRAFTSGKVCLRRDLTLAQYFYSDQHDQWRMRSLLMGLRSDVADYREEWTKILQLCKETHLGVITDHITPEY